MWTQMLPLSGSPGGTFWDPWAVETVPVECTHNWQYSCSKLSLFGTINIYKVCNRNADLHWYKKMSVFSTPVRPLPSTSSPVLIYHMNIGKIYSRIRSLIFLVCFFFSLWLEIFRPYSSKSFAPSHLREECQKSSLNLTVSLFLSFLSVPCLPAFFQRTGRSLGLSFNERLINLQTPSVKVSLAIFNLRRSTGSAKIPGSSILRCAPNFLAQPLKYLPYLLFLAYAGCAITWTHKF